MTVETWLNRSAAEQGRAIEAGRIDPVELTQAFLDAIAAHPDAMRIYARTTPQRALAEARAARQRARQGLRHGPLDGVPVSWKDLFDTAGVATEAGSALLHGRVPERDARVLRHATAAGLVCLGKSHMSELAFSGLGLNPVTATPPNINDRAAAPGGSSSGAAVSVAAGLAAAAVGSDTGGSVRIPAAWNDLIGLKTTAGRLSIDGAVPLARHFDTVGPLTRSVEDAALMLAALEGGRPPDLAGSTLRGARLLVPESVVFDEIRDTPRAACAAALDRLASAGAHITRAPVPPMAAAMPLSGAVFTGEAYGLWRDVIEARPDAMFRPILERFRSGAEFSAPDYVAAWRKLELLRDQYLAETHGYDALVVPTAPNMPPDAARLMDEHDYYVTENLLTLRNTRIANLLGLCALTLPTGTPSAGIALMSAPMTEARLLRLGMAAQAALT